jgi:hypothetical protein
MEKEKNKDTAAYDLSQKIVLLCCYLNPGYPLSETQKVIVDLIMEDEEGGEGISHFDRPILLPDDLENYMRDSTL